MSKILPYVACNDDPIYGDGKWYAIDENGNSSRPFETKEDVEYFLKEHDNDVEES